jgi:hypothetical protein
MTCRKMNEKLADLLFDPESVPAEVRKHVMDCADCKSELASLEATMKLLEDWHAPEPGAFFDGKLYARLRSEAAAPPPGFFSRMHAWMLYSSRLQTRQWAAAALAAMLAIGGGTFAFLNHEQPPAVEASATIRDLQSYDGNAQVFQQLNALDAGDESGSDASN